MRLSVLGSGSGGNSTLVECGKTTLLIDAGLSAKQITLRLDSLGIDPDSLDGILLTHEHGDHARGVDVLLRQRDIPVYANALTREAMMWNMKSRVNWRIFETGQNFSLGELEVSSFSIPHDAADPVAFVLEGEGARLGLVTDVGYVTQSMRNHLNNLDALCVEANYDETLLEEDTKRPLSTKVRISSKHGHLSNTQTGELVSGVACAQLSDVILVHLSSDCNDPNVAMDTVKRMLDAQDRDLVNIHCATQHEVTDWVEFGRREKSVHRLRSPLEQGYLF